MLIKRLVSIIFAPVVAFCLSLFMETQLIAETIGYDPSLGSLPTSQGWTIFEDPSSATRSPMVSDGLLHQGPTSTFDRQYWERGVSTFFEYTTDTAVLDLRIQVISSGFGLFSGGVPRTGYFVVIRDSVGRNILLGLASNRVILINSSSTTSYAEYMFNTTDGFHDYRVEIDGTGASLFIDNSSSPALTRGHGSPEVPASNVVFGAVTDVVASETKLESISFTVGSSDTTPPTADAGADQAIHAGNLVSLNGSQSFDDTTLSEDLLYSWSFVSVPAGSLATLGPDANDPTNPAKQVFTADVPGEYRVQLVVVDEAGNVSSPDEVVVSSNNIVPTADAGTDLAIVVQTIAFLDGSASVDPDLDPLSYSWTVLSAPSGSTATIVNPSTVTPSFTPDIVGTYLLQLVVNDGFEDSLPATVSVTAISASDAAQEKLRDASDLVGNLPDSAFSVKGHRNFFLNRISQALQDIQQGDITGAVIEITKAIERTDGCSLRGAPDPKGQGQQYTADFVTDCPSAMQLYSLLAEALVLIS